MESFAGKPTSGLEIGAYEGRSTCWLFENILTHADSTLQVVDPFEAFDGLAGDYKPRFLSNTKPYAAKIKLFEGNSRQFFNTSEFEYDFAIIDGSHKSEDVANDIRHVWDLLKTGGVMICDDFEWQGQGHVGCTDADKPKIAILEFLDKYHPEILHRDYQVIVRK